MAPPVLQLDAIELTFGGTPLLAGAEMLVHAGDRIALVGRNGSGKSTLLKIAAGQIEPQGGTVFRHPSSTIRYLPQAPDLDGHADVQSYVAAGLGPADDPYRASMLIEALKLRGDAKPVTLSGGEARRAALARVLAPQPDVLLLDEPTNHLDLDTIEWLEDELKRISSAIVLISHDRRFLETVSDSTVWLDRGQTKHNARGFAHFEEWRDTVLEEEERDQHKLGRQIVREEHWLRYGVTARRKRNMRRLGELQSLKAKHRTHRGAQGVAKLEASDAAQSGKLVVEAEAIGKSWGDLAVVRDFSIRIHRGDRIGLVGPNGAGKSTLLKMLIGELTPDSGSIRLGLNLEVASLDQGRTAPKPDETVAHFLTSGGGDTLEVNGQQRHVTAYLKDFLFGPEQARTPVRELSGGERARLILARVLARPANLLVLDEPTNDLDLETLDLLQELVASFDGTVLLVSHDRDFLDRTVTKTIAPDGDGKWTTYAGGYQDMLAQRGVKRFAMGIGKASSDPKSDTVRPAASAPKATTKSKLSFKQKFALENLPKQIATLGDDITGLESEMADPKLFARNPERFAKLADQLAAKRTTLETCEHEWLELDMLRV
jgi:ATP-binding cassette subfamily F protein uup